MKTITSSLDSKLAAYAALATAALAAPALPSADAALVVTPTNIAIPVNGIGVYLNVLTGVFNASPSLVPGWDVNPYGSASLSFFNPSTPTGGVYVGSGVPMNLTIGTLISGASTYASGGGTGFTFNSNQNYIGFRFTNESTSAVNYGYLQISLGASLTDPARAIVGYAYENTGLAIAVAPIAVPEPSTYGLLGLAGLGAIGLRAWRGRKAAAV